MLSPVHRPAESSRTRRPRAILLVLLLAAALGVGGCAVSTASRLARDAERRQDYDRAVAEYTKVVRLDPDNTTARLGLERAKQRAANEHFQRGRRLAAVGKYDQALVEYEAAFEFNPTSGDIEEQLRTTRAQLRAKIAVAREGKTELEALIDRARDLQPQGYDLPRDAKMPGSLTLSGSSSREAFQIVARFANISLAFDSTFRESPVTMDLRNASLPQALEQLSSATGNFFIVTGPGSVLVIPDTPAKRREFEEEVVQVFYLSNADVKETMDLLRVVLDARRISPITGTNALSIKDTRERIAAASRVIAAIDKARPEVIINVELLEVDRSRLQEYGLQIASPGSAGINGSATVAIDDKQTLTLQSLRSLTQADVLLANLPGLYYRLLKSDTNTRTLANPQLRTMEGTPAQARFGERVPVPTTIFTPFAAGGIAQQPVTSFSYETIGVNIDITPRTHHDDDVTLGLKIQVQSISGEGFNGLPTFGNREINTVIRLKDGETNMLAGLIRDEERRVLDGVPGLSDIPIVGRLFGHTKTEITQTDIILTLTPHIVRVLDLSEADLRPFRVGRDSLSGGLTIPLPVELPRPADLNPPPAPEPNPATPAIPPAIPPGTVAPPPPNPRLPGPR
jgi:general secretion pathway protein D